MTHVFLEDHPRGLGLALQWPLTTLHVSRLDSPSSPDPNPQVPSKSPSIPCGTSSSQPFFFFLFGGRTSHSWGLQGCRDRGAIGQFLRSQTVVAVDISLLNKQWFFAYCKAKVASYKETRYNLTSKCMEIFGSILALWWQTCYRFWLLWIKEYGRSWNANIHINNIVGELNPGLNSLAQCSTMSHVSQPQLVNLLEEHNQKQAKLVGFVETGCHYKLPLSLSLSSPQWAYVSAKGKLSRV
jgi:hypothetical protein